MGNTPKWNTNVSFLELPNLVSECPRIIEKNKRWDKEMFGLAKVSVVEDRGAHIFFFAKTAI